jgi:hypothetical protein
MDFLFVKNMYLICKLEKISQQTRFIKLKGTRYLQALLSAAVVLQI